MHFVLCLELRPQQYHIQRASMELEPAAGGRQAWYKLRPPPQCCSCSECIAVVRNSGAKWRLVWQLSQTALWHQLTPHYDAVMFADDDVSSIRRGCVSVPAGKEFAATGRRSTTSKRACPAHLRLLCKASVPEDVLHLHLRPPFIHMMAAPYVHTRHQCSIPGVPPDRPAARCEVEQSGAAQSSAGALLPAPQPLLANPAHCNHSLQASPACVRTQTVTPLKPLSTSMLANW